MNVSVDICTADVINVILSFEFKRPFVANSIPLKNNKIPSIKSGNEESIIIKILPSIFSSEGFYSFTFLFCSSFNFGTLKRLKI